eukprot:CAMPEP_0181121154 /NCGR_PEP_ID=MMETSP1071-20121207/24576_1 /TAXON_ID=35127 /ORGANISM="Thalassiosira sp., Strain NH16" /LENGTH=356 /DNA_ID=CAMNT_0023205933 /DNA_START=34 /DNA_END=1104 /DNA_ORIENTATION=-
MGQHKTIHLIRHGVALHNVPDARTGERPDLCNPRYTDPPLIRQGELQARVLGEQLRRMGLLLPVEHDWSVGATGGKSAGGDCDDGENGEDGAVTNDDGGDSMDIDVGQRDDTDGCDDNRNNHRGHSSDQEPIELVVCSPLTRCLQTASYIFPSYLEESGQGDGGAPAHSSSSSEPSLVTTSSTTARTVKDGRNDGNDSHHKLDRNCRVCCHGDVREAYGMHYPDKRSPLSQLKCKFPTVTYHPLLAEDDVDWRPDSRETRRDVSRRIRNFFVWLMRQPHESVAVVTHGVWMECALLEYCPEALEYGRRRVYNCDVYRGKLSLLEKGVSSGSGNNAGDFGGGDVILRDVEKVVFHHI